MDGCMDGRMNGCMHGRTDAWMEGRMNGWIDGCMDGCMDGRTDAWMDGWREKDREKLERGKGERGVENGSKDSTERRWEEMDPDLICRVL
jgi:hypothetical protein